MDNLKSSPDNDKHSAMNLVEISQEISLRNDLKFEREEIFKKPRPDAEEINIEL